MEAQWYDDRTLLRTLLRTQPSWTLQDALRQRMVSVFGHFSLSVKVRWPAAADRL